MARRSHRYRRAAWLAVAVNGLSAAGCVALLIAASDRAGAVLAIGGIVFFAAAALGFGVMLRLASTTTPGYVSPGSASDRIEQ